MTTARFSDADIRRAHLIDDHERQRTGALRAVTAQVDLLTTALTALAAGDAHVTAEYLDRSITVLRLTADLLGMDTSCPCSTCESDGA